MKNQFKRGNIIYRETRLAVTMEVSTEKVASQVTVTAGKGVVLHKTFGTPIGTGS